MDTLYNRIAQHEPLAEAEQASLFDLLSRGCRGKTRRALRSAIAYGLHTVELCGILRRVTFDGLGRAHYCAGQSYPDEIRTVRKVICGR